MKKKSAVLVALIGLPCACAEPGPEPGPEPARGELDVLFLNVELLRADHVGLLNPESRLTPNIDRFFADAIVFEDCSAPAGETARSSAAVLSAVEGMFFQSSWRIRREIREQKERHADRLTSIAEILAAEGFTTVDVNEGNRSGKHIGYDTGFERYVELEEGTLMEESVAVLLRELEQLGDERFFVLFHPYALHAPGYAYPAGRERIAHDAVDHVDEGDRVTVHARFDGLDDDAKRELARALYAQQLGYVDEELGAVFAVLEERHAADTIVVLFANHGEGLFDNGVEAHGVSYQSCVHVPLLVRHPRISGPIRVREPVSLVDLVPTVCDALGVEIGRETLGTSLLPLVHGGAYGREYVFGANLQSQFVRWGDWKLIAGPEELYDVRRDPHEEHNLLHDHPDVARRLRLALAVREKEVAEFRVRSGDG